MITNVGDLPLFWASFNNAPRRIQNGGWAWQVTQYDFQISEEIAGVNMRLTRGGIRELHWHLAAEWAYVTYGSCRVTTIDQSGRANVEDVHEGGLWYFPAGLPPSLQGIGNDGYEFNVVGSRAGAKKRDLKSTTYGSSSALMRCACRLPV
jgi:oxalate decarboxylase